MTIYTIRSSGHLTYNPPLPDEMHLNLFMREVHHYLKIIVCNKQKNIGAKTYLNMWSDYLKCSSLFTLNQQKKIVDMTSRACLFGLLLNDKLKYRDKHTCSSTQIICSISHQLIFSKFPNGIYPYLKKYTYDLEKAYCFSQRTFKTFAFFSQVFVDSRDMLHQLDALREFISSNERPNLVAVEQKNEKLANVIAKSLKNLHFGKLPTKSALKRYLRKLQNYESVHKEWVETPNYDVIYNRVIELA